MSKGDKSDVDGKTAVVTGGATGIGKAISKMLIGAGASVTIMGRDEERLDKVSKEIGAQAIRLDVADEDSVASAFENHKKQSGALDILVNNAGMAQTALLERTTLEQFENSLAVNLTGTFLCIRAVLPGMKTQQKGTIINIASTAGLKGYPYVSAYVAAKHGVVGLTKSLAEEVGAQNITVNAICPGFTDTEMVSRSIDTIMEKTGRSKDEALKELTSSNPQGRLVKPEEVAGTVLWLCGDNAAAINGQSIAVAGGEVM